MPKKKAAGRGALGSAKARFFHPRKPIRDYLKHNYDKEVLHNVLVDDKKEIRINKKVQMTYECCIKEIDEANVFSIVCCNSKAMQAGITPFPDEIADRAATAPTNDHADLRASNTNSESHVNMNYSSTNDGTQAADIARLRSEGVEVNDEAVDPKNIAPPTAATRRWKLPHSCPQKSDPNTTNSEERWKTKSWNIVKEMDLLSVFSMCMPEQCIKDDILKVTNKHLDEKLTLSEFYKWLGCRFYMACYVGISPINLWWSKEETGMFKGAPFRLDHIMSLNRFQAIDKAI